MTELSFLIELLLNHELKKETKDLIAGRIKEVEQNLTPMRPSLPVNNPFISLGQTLGAPVQAASTLAAMQRHGATDHLAPQIPVVLTGAEAQARENSIEILKKRKEQRLKV